MPIVLCDLTDQRSDFTWIEHSESASSLQFLIGIWAKGYLTGSWVTGRQPHHRQADLRMGSSSQICTDGWESLPSQKQLLHTASGRGEWVLLVSGASWDLWVCIPSDCNQMFISEETAAQLESWTSMLNRRLNSAYEGADIGREYWGAVGSRI